ncbi:MAG: bifunctional hydroxymethylpyrimidine kinase/phosphomethylpyrimidine kinase [Bacteroidota bacterium]
MSDQTTARTLNVLTIAGSDSGGGAGIQADLKTLHAHGVHGLCVVNAVTAQNSQGVSASFQIPMEMVKFQLNAVFDDYQVDAIKIGMLGEEGAVRIISQFIEDNIDGIPIVLDPVMVATSGDRLFKSEAQDNLRNDLIPKVTLITPNVPEASELITHDIATKDDLKVAARKLRKQFPGVAVLLKGGHLLEKNDVADDTHVIDYLITDAGEYLLRAPIIDRPYQLHGGGCTLSSSIAAHLAMGYDLPEAVYRARAYLQAAIEAQPGDIGQGAQSVKHAVDPEKAFRDTPVRLKSV